MGNWTATYETMTSVHFLTPYIKGNSKWIKDLKVITKSIKFLEKSIGKALFDVNSSYIIFESLFYLIKNGQRTYIDIFPNLIYRANRYRERCSTMITIRELQIKNSLHMLIINTDEDVKKKEYLNTLVLVLSRSHVWLFVILWTAACQASLSFTISQSLPKLMSIELVMPSNHLSLCCPLLLPSILPSIRRSFPVNFSSYQLPKY